MIRVKCMLVKLVHACLNHYYLHHIYLRVTCDFSTERHRYYKKDIDGIKYKDIMLLYSCSIVISNVGFKYVKV